MYTYRTSVICIILFCWLILFTSCGQPAAPAAGPTATIAFTAPPLPTATVISIRSGVSSPPPAPQQYTSHVILSGAVRPDDLTFDQQGRLLFSDFYNGTVSRINANGTVTTILS